MVAAADPEKLAEDVAKKIEANPDQVVDPKKSEQTTKQLEKVARYSAKTQPRDARGRFRQVLARIKQDLGVSGNADALKKIEQAENLDFAGNYKGAVDAATDLINIIDRLDSGALNSTSLENVRTSSAELGKVIANLPFAFGDQSAKIRYSDVPPALKDLIDDMIKRVEKKIGPKDAAEATHGLKDFMSGQEMLSQSDISSRMSVLLRLLT